METQPLVLNLWHQMKVKFTLQLRPYTQGRSLVSTWIKTCGPQNVSVYANKKREAELYEVLRTEVVNNQVLENIYPCQMVNSNGFFGESICVILQGLSSSKRVELLANEDGRRELFQNVGVYPSKCAVPQNNPIFS